MVLGAVVGGAVVAVVMLMMAAHGVRIVRQLPGQQGGHCLVRVAGHAGVELDAGLARAVRAPPPMPPQISAST